MATTTGSTGSTDKTPTGQTGRAATPLGRAWTWVALVPVFFIVSFAVQTGIYALTGYDPSTGDVPLWADLTAAIPGLAIVLVPCVVGVVYGVRAVRSGVRAGMVPLVVAALLGVGVTVLTAVNV